MKMKCSICGTILSADLSNADETIKIAKTHGWKNEVQPNIGRRGTTCTANDTANSLNNI
ncbi:MAG: hypothetical protein LBN30_03225 [Oscillospiraceae bacterium]|jgi:hypothetical protein|nr:hypothetical protein [Oscillospiraceae bacterium]